MSFDSFSILDQYPSNIIVFEPNDPIYTILFVNKNHRKNISSDKGEFIGKALIDVFPPTQNGWNAEAIACLINSLRDVIRTKKINRMPVVRYDIKRDGEESADIVYWSPENHPVLDENGNLKYILHTVVDATFLFGKINR